MQALPSKPLTRRRRACHGCGRALVIPRRTILARTSSSSGRADVVAIGNICLDVVIPMEQLPPADTEVRRRLLDQLTHAPPNQVSYVLHMQGGRCVMQPVI